MLIRFIISFMLLFSFSQAYFMTQNVVDMDTSVLRDFDVDMKFAKDFMYLLKADKKRDYKIKYFFKVVKQGQGFIPMFRQIMKDNGVPESMVYLAMAESNFSPHAISHSRATGLWQFMSSTARKFGLNVNEYIDERKDPLKSTRAAARYLKYLHGMFGKWYLAIMAYNCGDGRLRKAIRRAGSSDLGVLLDAREKYLPKETRLYMRKILSLALLASNKKIILAKGNEYLLNQGNHKPFDVVKVPPFTSLIYVANIIGVDIKRLKALNPQLKYYFAPPNKGYVNIYIPHSKKVRFIKSFRAKKVYDNFYVHVVKTGETLSSIGRKYKIRYSIIKKFNHLNSNKLKLGQKLIIPTMANIDLNTHTFKSSNSFYDTWKKSSIKVGNLKKINGYKEYIQLGDKIVMPS